MIEDIIKDLVETEIAQMLKLLAASQEGELTPSEYDITLEELPEAE